MTQGCQGIVIEGSEGGGEAVGARTAVPTTALQDHCVGICKADGFRLAHKGARGIRVEKMRGETNRESRGKRQERGESERSGQKRGKERSGRSEERGSKADHD